MVRKYARLMGLDFFSLWDSEHVWNPLLEKDHSTIFKFNCNRYDHYFDAVKGNNSISRDSHTRPVNSREISQLLYYP